MHESLGSLGNKNMHEMKQQALIMTAKLCDCTDNNDEKRPALPLGIVVAESLTTTVIATGHYTGRLALLRIRVLLEKHLIWGEHAVHILC